MLQSRLLVLSLLLICAADVAHAAVTWDSATTGGTISGDLRVPQQPAANRDGAVATIVYLKNLSIPRVGREGDEAIMGDLLRDGYLVLVLDYGKNSRATSPDLAADV